VLTKTLSEAERINRVARGFDPGDPYSRKPVQSSPSPFRRIGVLPDNEREFFGDSEYARLYAQAVGEVSRLGWSLSEFDYRPFREAADLLYSGPWVAERYAAARSVIETNPDAVHSVVRAVILGARKFSAVDVFESQYRLAALTRNSERTWESCDAILLPSAGTIYTIEQMLADPIQLNTNLGRYTNFMNLLDLCGIAVPAGFRSDNVPFGVTFFAPAWREPLLFKLAREFVN
jgi:allophanate hydrolase